MEITRKKRSSVTSDDSNNFRNFLRDLEEIGELIKIKKTVSPRFELPAVGSRARRGLLARV